MFAKLFSMKYFKIMNKKSSQNLFELTEKALEKPYLKKAQELCEKLIQKYPKDHHTHFLFGILYQKQGKLDQAKHSFEQSISLKKDNPEAYFFLANIYLEEKKIHQAQAHYQKALRFRKSFLEARFNLAMSYKKEKKNHQAIGEYLILIKHFPSHAPSYLNLGNLFQEKGYLHRAKQCYLEALKIHPNLAHCHNNLAGIYLIEKKFPRAEEHLKQALRLHKNDPTIVFHLANLYKQWNKHDKAIEYYEKTLSLEPKFFQAHNNLGLLYSKKMPQKAVNSFKQALKIDPENASILANLATLKLREGKIVSAKKILEKAHKIGTKHLSLKSSLGNLYLFLGMYEKGWPLVCDRPPLKRSKEGLSLTSLLNLNLKGRKILIKKEQGMGEELLFLRFANTFKKRGAQLFYHCHEKLYPLLKEFSPFEKVEVENLRMGHYDSMLYVGDLALACKLFHEKDIPPPIKLFPSQKELASVKTMLENFAAPPYIAFQWSAGGSWDPNGVWESADHVDIYREIAEKKLPLEDFIEAIKDIPGSFICMENNVSQKNAQLLRKKLKGPLLYLDCYDDLEKALALLFLVDELICISSLYTHLRVCLGKSSHVILPTMPTHFAWGLKGKKSPWFPGCRLYRQDQRGSWERAFQDLKQRMKRAFPL